MTWLRWIKFMVLVLPFVLLCLRSKAINLPLKERGHQFLMPLIALVYCIPSIFFVDKIAAGINYFFGRIAAAIALVPLLGTFFRWLGDNMELRYFQLLVANTVIMAGFCVTKRLILPVLRRTWGKLGRLYAATSGCFYEERPKQNISVLRMCFTQARRLLTALYYAAVAVAGLDALLYLIYSDSSVFDFPSYPVFAVILLGECAFFLGGLNERELYSPDADDEEIEGENGDFEKLSRMLEHSFGDRLLYRDTGIGTAKPPETYERLADMAAGEDAAQRIAGPYFEHIRFLGLSVEMDYVDSAVLLLKGNSVLLCNPFYRDMTQYLVLPILHNLLNHHACLVISGRKTGDNDVEEWIKEGIGDATGLKNLWKVQDLRVNSGDDFSEPDIGVLGFNELYDLRVQEANRAFFSRVRFIVLLEPSNLLGTGQVGLRSVLQQCGGKNDTLCYCACDRNCDGLVDALSHITRRSITEVTASPVSRNPYHEMLWAADGPGLQSRVLPHVSRYLGFGTELGLTALREQVPHVDWFGGVRMPLADLRWTVGQYFRAVCSYVGVPAQQSEIDRRFAFHVDLWQAKPRVDGFLLVEDEFNNQFEMARAFAARTRHKGFVNILSEQYLLREYMSDNAQMFEADPKAVPTIVPDYARTERNFILRSLLLMAAGRIEETTLHREMLLYNCVQQDVYEALKQMVARHTGMPEALLRVEYEEDTEATGRQITHKYFTILPEDFESYFRLTLSPAYYLIENEQDHRYFMGARMMGHITQSILPGQFFCYDGKYYQTQTISEKDGIVVRRASDHLSGRHCYRQLRRYQLNHVQSVPSTERSLRGLAIQVLCADISVATDGYLDANAAGALCDAPAVMLDCVPQREYHNKNLLRIALPNTADLICITLCALLNEIFTTVYPNEAAFLVAIPSCTMREDTVRQAVVPDLRSDWTEEVPCIYLVEDSYIDLGLTISANRNLQRLLEIAADYLEWYLDPERNSEPNIPEDPAARAPRKEREDKGTVSRLTDWLRQLLGREKPSAAEASTDKESVDTAASAPSSDSTVEPAHEANGAAATVDTTNSVSKPTEKEQSVPATEAAAETILADKTALTDVEGEDEEVVSTGTVEEIPAAPEKHIEDFLHYGFDTVPEWLDLSATNEWMQAHGFQESALHVARKHDSVTEEIARTYDPDDATVSFCDFCGEKLVSGKYDRLKDGRERCEECSRTAVRNAAQFRKLFERTMREMENLYNIRINVPVKVRMTNARKVNRLAGNCDYHPTAQCDARVSGFASADKRGNFTLYVENAAPEAALRSVIVHELTHIWQYINWNKQYINTKYGAEKNTMIYEGMAVWSEIQFMLSMGEKAFAKREEIMREHEDTSYGKGMRLYRASYKFRDKKQIQKRQTPFGHLPPL